MLLTEQPIKVPKISANELDKSISVYFGKVQGDEVKLQHGYGLQYCHTHHDGYFEYTIYHGLF